MNCLFDFIGLRSCSTDEPISGIWINDYPGMSTELLDKVASSDQVTYVGVWKSMQRQAYVKLRSDIQKILREQSNVRLDQVIYKTNKPFVNDQQSIQTLAADTLYRGVFVSIAGSKYLALRVNHIGIYNASGPIDNVEVKIIQTQDQTELWSDSVSLVAGMNKIQVNETFASEFDKVNMALLVDCSTFDTVKGPFMDWGWITVDQECASRFSNYNEFGAFQFPIEAPLDYSLTNTWTQSGNQNGIFWDADLVCSIDQFICSQKMYLIEAWARLLCITILRTKLATDRVNYFSKSNGGTTRENLGTFLDEYTDALNSWGQQLNLDGEGLCFDCSDSTPIRFGSRLP